MWLDDSNINGHGSVQTCHPGVGMGIKFTNLPREAMRRLDSYLHGASSVSSGETAQPYIR
jgi:hypothetical protein